MGKLGPNLVCTPNQASNFQVWSILHKLDTKRKLKYKEMMKSCQILQKKAPKSGRKKRNKEQEPKSRQAKEPQRMGLTMTTSANI